MAKNETRRIKPAVIQADKDSFAALKDQEDYAPANSDFSVPKITVAENEMTAAQQKEAQDYARAAASRDDAAAKEWVYHNIMLGAKDQVAAQHGRDSNQFQAVGLKKKSEYKTRAKKGPKKPGQS